MLKNWAVVHHSPVSIVSLLARIDILSKSGNPNIIPNLPVAKTSPPNGLDKREQRRWAAVCPINCLSLKSFPDKQTQVHYRAASSNIYFSSGRLVRCCAPWRRPPGEGLEGRTGSWPDPLGRGWSPRSTVPRKMSRLRARIEEGPRL